MKAIVAPALRWADRARPAAPRIKAVLPAGKVR